MLNFAPPLPPPHKARHLTTLVSDDEHFSSAPSTGSGEAAAGKGGRVPDAVHDHDYSSPSILLFTEASSGASSTPNRTTNSSAHVLTLPAAANHAGGGSAGLAAVGGGLETVLFGVTIMMPLNNAKVNTSAWVFRSGVVDKAGGFNVARQIWQTRDTVCGEWWSDRCTRRFYEHPPLALSHTRIEG